MNIGRNILELRKQKCIKQEELAAELGVTAAAVSKWENGYTLPDILMLCALADFFEVTTDDLLGRNNQHQYAVIIATDRTLGYQIQEMAVRFGILTQGIYTNSDEAIEAVRSDNQISHLLYGHLGNCGPEIDFSVFSSENDGNMVREIKFYISSSENEADILAELESCLK